MASATATASVPKVVSSSPAATAMAGRPSSGTISDASPTAACAKAWLCDTTTIPITDVPFP